MGARGNVSHAAVGGIVDADLGLVRWWTETDEADTASVDGQNARWAESRVLRQSVESASR